MIPVLTIKIFLAQEIKIRSQKNSISELPNYIAAINLDRRMELSSEIGSDLLEVLSKSFTKSFQDLGNLLESSPVAKKWAIGSLTAIIILITLILGFFGCMIYLKRSRKYTLVSNKAPPRPPRILETET